MIVYLDTNVYIGANYIFDREKFATLRSRVEEGKITVLYTSATIGEVMVHMKQTVDAGVTAYNRLLRKDLACLRGDEVVGVEALSTESILEHLKSNLDEFLAMDGVECISLNPLDAEKLLDDYFNMVAPFEKKKPDEFKDAIMINAVKQYQASCGEEVCIVSSDEGFRKAFIGDDNFRTFEYISGFFKYYQKQDELAEFERLIVAALDDGEYDNVFEGYCEGLSIDRDCESSYWECVDSCVEGVTCSLSYIEEKDGKLYAIIDVEADLTAEFSYRDDDKSYYDKEDDQYLIEHFITTSEKHRPWIEVRVLCTFSKDEEQQHLLEDLSVVKAKRFPTLELTDDTMYSFEETGNSFEESEDIEYCSECSQIIGRYSDIDYWDYQGNPICSKCAVSNSHGEICPACGRKYPHELMMGAFCQACTLEMD